MNANTLGDRKETTPSLNSSASESPELLTIEGRPNSPTRIAAKLMAAILSVGLGVLLWENGSWADDDGGTMRSVAIVCFLIALALPHHRHKYLDLKDRRLVATTAYAWLQISKTVRPLTEFNRIVVRYVCHPGGEGPDTYSGSVGLKPMDGTAVVWIKTFPTTEDEVPREAYEFALYLHSLIGLPFNRAEL